MRGLAAGLVVIYHAKFILWSGGNQYLSQHPRATWSALQYAQFVLDLLSSCGKQCVLLFFILSAFVIRHSARRSFALPTFFRNRVLRIYPPYLVSIGLAALALYVATTYINPALLTPGLREFNTRLIEARNTLTWSSALMALAFLKPGEYIGFNMPYWSLLHEALFYLLFPLYLRTNVPVKLALMVGCTVGMVATGSSFFYYQLYFLFGLLLYDFFSRGYSLPLNLPRWLYAAAFVGLFLVINGLKHLPHEYYSDITTALLTFLAFEFLLYRAQAVPRSLFWLGDISYSLYLNHMASLILTYAVITRATGQLMLYDRWPYYLGSLVGFGMGALTYYLVERPSVQLLARLKGKPAGLQPVLATK